MPLSSAAGAGAAGAVLNPPNVGLTEEALKENAGADGAALLPKENPLFDADASAGFAAPNENGEAAGFSADSLGAPKGAPVFADGGATPMENPPEDEDVPKLNPAVEEDGVEDPKEKDFAGVDPEAPPKASVGALPSGPNLPNLDGGSATGVVVDGAKVLASGVVGCRGPDGAKENSPLPPFAVEALDETGVAAFLAGGSLVDSSLSRASFIS